MNVSKCVHFTNVYQCLLELTSLPFLPSSLTRVMVASARGAAPAEGPSLQVHSVPGRLGLHQPWNSALGAG